MKNRSAQILALTFSVLVLVGCHKLEATTKIGPNGSGELRMGVGFSTEERANLEEQGANPQDFCNTSQKNPNITVTQEQRGDETWCFSVIPFKNLEELRGLYGEKEGIKINRLEINDDKFYYDIDLDTLSDNSSFSTLTDIKWSLELPGKPLDHNADQVEGNTLTWTSTPENGVINLRAESEIPRSGGGFPSCSSAFIVLAAGLIYWQGHGRKSSIQ